MQACSIECSSQACSPTPRARRCHAIILLQFREPIVLPPQGSELSPKTKKQALKVLPYLCPQAKAETCEIEISADNELSGHAEYLYDALRETPLALEARKWVQSLARYPDAVPEPVVRALKAIGHDRILELFIEARDRLWASTATHRLA